MSGTIHSTDAFGQEVAVKNIILVHGIFVDGSGWEGVYKILTSRGYHVIIVQNPTTSLEDDVAAVNRALDKQDGPVILVGHSWGRAVISEAGVSPKVAGLVYVAAFQPDAGESALTQFKSEPALIEGCILPPDSAGFFYADKAKFRACSSADLLADKVEFMSVSQIPVTGKALSTPLTQAAWKTRPCWGIVPTADKSLNPVLGKRKSRHHYSNKPLYTGRYVQWCERTAQEIILRLLLDPRIRCQHNAFKFNPNRF